MYNGITCPTASYFAEPQSCMRSSVTQYLALVTQYQIPPPADLTVLQHITLFHVPRKFHDLMAKLIKLLIPTPNPRVVIYCGPASVQRGLWQSRVTRFLSLVRVERKEVLWLMSRHTQCSSYLLVRVTAAIERRERHHSTINRHWKPGLKGQWRWANEKLSSKFAAPFAYWSS